MWFWASAPFRWLYRWYQRTDWTRHTAVAAAVVAAASLAVSAWGTWKSAQVADDQLAQSREDHQEEGRKLTSHLTMWKTERDDSGGVTWTQFVANRNLEPVIVYLKIASEELWTQPNGRIAKRPLAGMVLLGTIPPCTRYEIPYSVLETQVSPRFRLTFWSIASLVAAEPSGTLWQRLPGGDIKSLTARDRRDIALAEKEIYVPAPLEAKDSKATGLTPCGSTN